MRASAPRAPSAEPALCPTPATREFLSRDDVVRRACRAPVVARGGAQGGIEVKNGTVLPGRASSKWTQRRAMVSLSDDQLEELLEDDTEEAEQFEATVDRFIRSKDLAALTVEYAMKLPPSLALFVAKARAPHEILLANKRCCIAASVRGQGKPYTTNQRKPGAVAYPSLRAMAGGRS